MWGSVCGEGGLQEPGLKRTRLLVKALSEDARRKGKRENKLFLTRMGSDHIHSPPFPSGVLPPSPPG